MALLTADQIRDGLAQLSDWRQEGASIARDAAFADFAAALEFVNRVAAAAEQANHHPDILLHGWNRVRLTLSTHSSGGITAADLDLAARIDTLL
jgi:4a-hydroxytetrahydrobiopterin dehydratase